MSGAQKTPSSIVHSSDFFGTDKSRACFPPFIPLPLQETQFAKPQILEEETNQSVIVLVIKSLNDPCRVGTLFSVDVGKTGLRPRSRRDC